MGPDLRFSFMYVDYSENAPEFYIGKKRQELDLASITQRQLDAHDQQLQNREPFFDLRYSRQKIRWFQNVYLNRRQADVFSGW